MKFSKTVGSIIFVVLLLVAMQCPAAIITYEGHDSGAGPVNVRPNSDAAQAAFLAAVTASGPYTLDFESIPVQYSNTINLTTMTLYQVGTINDANAGVTQVTGDAILGYNTTAGGNTYLRIVPEFGIGTAGARLVFNSPVEFFGAYYTGLGTAAGSLSVQFTADGTDYSYAVTGDGYGGVNYFGFTTFGTPITEVTMVLTGVTSSSRDIYSIDDITTGLQGTYVPAPEPSMLLLLGTAIIGLMVGRKKLNI